MCLVNAFIQSDLQCDKGFTPFPGIQILDLGFAGDISVKMHKSKLLVTAMRTGHNVLSVTNNVHTYFLAKKTTWKPSQKF